MNITKVKSLFSEITEIPPVLNESKYPSLNGLRGVSIIMVLVHHFLEIYTNKFQYMVFIGPLGVDIFFVISGFLITTICLKEKILTKNISLKKFYIKRILRILPVAYLFILVIAILDLIYNLKIIFQSFIAAIFFLADISYFRKLKFDWYLAHFWSLSVEEQFYILFPIFLKKKFLFFFIIILFISFVIPLLFVFLPFAANFKFNTVSSIIRYLMKFQGISVGCLFSILLFKGYFDFGKLKALVTITSVILIFSIKYNPNLTISSCFLNLIISILIGCIVVNNISYSNNYFFKLLNSKILNTIGILSYSVYIWQQLFLSNDPRLTASKYPLNLLFLIIVPCLSYFLYEKRFLKLKSKLDTRTITTTIESNSSTAK